MQPELSLGEAVRQGARLLEDGGIDAPRLTAEVLLAHALGRERSYLYAHSTDRLPELAWIHFGRWLHERLQGKPTQYITRRQEFYGRDFEVGPGVLIPRPETEHVIEAVLSLPKIAGPIVDVGTGSGCIAITLSLELRRSTIACDIAPMDIARRNAKRLEAGVHFFYGDLLMAVRTASLVVTNPPYIPSGDTLSREVAAWEPHRALFAGSDGLDAWRRIIEQTPGGSWLVGEIDSRADMLSLFGSSWEHQEIRPDLAGRARVVVAHRK